MKISMQFAALVLGLSSAVQVQAKTVSPNTSTGYPARPVTIVVPFPPGGTNDIVGRLLAQYLQADLRQPFIVENRGGAGGIIGTELVAKAKPDGYTLLAASSGPMATSLALYKNKIHYDVMRDFSAIATLIDVTVVVTANPNFPARSIKDLIRIAKQKPGSVRAALPAVGSMHHLLTALFQLDTGTKLNMIPYKGSGPAVLDLLGGHVDIDFDNMPAVISQIRANKLRALAVASESRNPELPNTPTLKELGLKNLVAAPWFVLVAPKDTPAEITNMLNSEVKKIFAKPEVQKKLQEIGANSAWKGRKETREFLSSEISRWATVVKETGVTVD
ncbi:Bug family tripartite tricarboxylate transporter substrate binding protein [Candidimonas nitroreducens]|nr:tripartite tricarboxylate transporter substrate binding protein [Candidimonas nitroreducens]